MPIEKLPIHYAYSATSISVHDEDSMTALELQGRHGKKINEIIEAQNQLQTSTEKELENQNSYIQKITDETMPKKVETEIQNQIDNGSFDSAINNYTGNLEGRLDNFLKTIPNGSTSMDAEIIDGRHGQDNVNYPNLGEAFRKQIGQLKGEQALPLMNARIDIDTISKLVTISALDSTKMVVIQGRIMRRVWNANQFEPITYDFTGKNNVIYNIVLNCDSNEMRFTSTQDYQYTRTPYNHNDIILATLYIVNGNVGTVFFAPEKSLYINGQLYSQIKHPKYVLNVVDVSFNFYRSSKKLVIKTLGTGFIYFSDGNFIKLNENISIDMTSFTSAQGSTRYLIYDNNEFKFISSGNLNPYNEAVVMGVYLDSTGAVVSADLSKCIHALICVKENTYVDGANAISDFSSLNILDTLNRSTINIFNRVCCIGDSLTSGHMQNPDGETIASNKDYAYPAFMSKLTGSKWYNCGISGANVLTWQSYGGWNQVDNIGKCQLYVIGLMVNDCSESERGIPVGTSADIHTSAQTYYAGLSKIIDGIYNRNPKAHIFVMNPPKTSEIYQPYQNAVRAVTSSYNSDKIHCIELSSDLYVNSSFTGDELAGHWTATGYEQMAEILAYSFSKYINENVTKFQDVAFIPYDKE